MEENQGSEGKELAENPQMIQSGKQDRFESEWQQQPNTNKQTENNAKKAVYNYVDYPALCMKHSHTDLLTLSSTREKREKR